MILQDKKFYFLHIASTYWPVALILLWTVMLMLINHDWYFTPVSFVDPAIYIGWFLHPQLYRELFPLAHTGDLFPLTLPNAVAYYYFGPVVGNIIIKGISFFVAQLCMFVVVRQLFNVRTAIFCVIAFSCSRYVLMAIGADYTDGRVIVYLLLSMASGISASAPNQRYPRLLYAMAGVWALFMVSTAMLSAVLLLLLFGMCMIGRGVVSHKVSPHRTAIIWMTGGFIAAFAILGLIDATFMGGDGFYLRNVIERAISYIGQNRVLVSNWENAGLWLVPSATIVPVGISAAFILIKHHSMFDLKEWHGRALLCVTLGTILAYGTFIGLQYFKNQETLSNGFYLNFLLPLVYVLLGAIIYPLTRTSHSALFWFLMAGFALVSVQVVVGLSQYAITLQSLFPCWASSAAFSYEVAVLSLGLLACIMCIKYPAIRLMGVLIVVLAVNFYSASHIFPTQFTAHRREENFKTILEWDAHVSAQDAQRKGFVWYDVYEPSGAVFMQMSAASHMWTKWGQVSENFPLVEFQQLVLMKQVVERDGHAVLFLFSTTPQHADNALALISASGLHAQLISRKNYWSLGKGFTVYQFNVTDPQS